MRNLILILALSAFLTNYAGAQSIKVEGSGGSTNNYFTRFEGNYFTVVRNDGYAIVGLDGKTIANGIKAPVMGMIRQFNLYHGILFVDDGGNIDLKNIKGQKLGTGKYQEIQPFMTDNTAVKIPTPIGTWVVAYIDTAGREIVRFDVRKFWSAAHPQNAFESIGFVSLNEFLPFSEGLTPLPSPQTSKYGYIDKKLKLVIPVEFKQARPFSDGLAAVQNADGNWGYINKTGKLVIPYTFSMPPSRFMDGLAKVQDKEGRWGYINKENHVVIQPKYQYASGFYKGYALAREAFDKSACLIDSTGAVITTFRKDMVYIDHSKPPYSSGIEPDLPFYVSETLQQLVDEGMGLFTNGLNYGLVDKNGKIVLDFKYQYLSDFHNGKMFAHYSAFVNNSTRNQLGIINEEGNWLIEIVPSQF